MTDKQGRIVGFEIDLLKVMSQALGVELELVAVPYTELLPGLQAKKFDMIGSGMTVTQERNLKLNFSDAFHRGGPDRAAAPQPGRQGHQY